MSDDPATGSLAEQAATWVPPWARQPERTEEPEARDDDAAVVDASADDRDAATDESDPVTDESDAVTDESDPVTDESDAATDGFDAATDESDAPAIADAGEAVVTAEPEPGLSEILEDFGSHMVSDLPRSEVGPGYDEAGTAAAAVVADADTGAQVGPTEILEEPPRSEGSPGYLASELGTDPAEIHPDELAATLAGSQAAPIDLRGAVEAILLVVDEPVSEIILAQVLDMPTERIRRVLDELTAEYARERRGFDLRRAAGGWRLYTRGDYAAYVEKFILDGQQVRLTQAALETLAVIAYKQPATRSRISAIRGVNCDGVVRTLLARGLIEECGTEPDSGAFLYRTTTLFLEKLGIDSVDDLPPLAPFLPDDVDEIANAQG
jgi:segregation and condensation protein B